MITQFKDYNIELIREEDTSNVYDRVYLGKSEFTLTTKIGLRTYQSNLLICSAMIGAEGVGTGIHNTSYVVEEGRITICCSDSIFCLSIPNLDLLWKTRVDEATCFEVFKIHDGYIVHGELEISRIDLNGNIVWQRSGADIFTTEKGVDDFEITDSHIRAIDWGGRTYTFDFDGILIE